MEDGCYWIKQIPGQAAFDEVAWSKPERRDQSGRLSIIGGSSKGFWGVAVAYGVIAKEGVGQIRVVMPDSLRKKIPLSVSSQIDDLIYTDSNPSGGFARQSINIFDAAANWCDNVLLVGDNGANSETAALLEKFLNDNPATNITIARDSVDLLINSAELMLSRTNLNLVVSFGQLQKIFRTVFYPRVITFSQGVKQIAETLHKFTITYPVTITLYHQGNLLVAHSGRVVSQEFSDSLRVWNGEVPARISAWRVWQSDPLKATATSWVDL